MPVSNAGRTSSGSARTRIIRACARKKLAHAEPSAKPWMPTGMFCLTPIPMSRPACASCWKAASRDSASRMTS